MCPSCDGRARNHFTELRVGGQEPHTDETGRNRLGHIDGRDEEGRPAAVIAQEIRQAGVAAALAAHVVLQNKMGDDDCTVQSAEQVAQNGANCDSPDHPYSSLSPF